MTDTLGKADGFDPDFVAALPVRRLRSGGALYVAGPAPTRILFVPGGFHGAWCVGGWMATLSRRGIGCAALDFPGHGFIAHEGLAPSTGVLDYVAIVSEAALALGGELVMIGHSLGALVVARASVGIDAAAIVLLAPSPPANLPGAGRVPARPAHALVPVPSRQEAIERFLGGESPLWADRFHDLLSPESPTVLNDRYELRISVDPARLPARALVIAAGHDDALRHPERQDAAVAEMYGADYEMLTDAPHCMMLGGSSALALGVILDWLLRVSPSRPKRTGRR